MIRSRPALTTSAYLSMLFLGLSASLVGAAARNIGLSPGQIGLLIAAQNVGFLLAVTVSGALADSVSKPRLLLVGSLILAFSLFTFYGTPIYAINLLIMFLSGLGIGVYEGVTDAMLIDLHEHNVSRHININHFFVTLGSIIITVYLIFLQDAWRSAILQAGVLVLLLAGFFLLARMEARRRPVEGYRQRLKVIAGQPVVIALFAASVLVVGIEAGAIGILTTYLMDMRGFTQVTSKLALLVFLVGVAVGRLAVGLLVKTPQIKRTLLGLYAGLGVVLALLFLFDLGQASFAVVFLCGVAISAILPLMLSMAGLLYKEIAGMVLGTIKIAFPLGGILLPAVFSALVEGFSLQAAMLLFPASAVLGTVILALSLRNVQIEG